MFTTQIMTNTAMEIRNLTIFMGMEIRNFTMFMGIEIHVFTIF